MHALAHEFTSRKVSPWGGMKLFKQAYDQSGMAASFDSGHWPFPQSNRGYDSKDLIEQFMTCTVLGARRLAHCEYLRADEVVREIFGWSKGMASPSTLSRFFAKCDTARNARTLPLMFRDFWSRIAVQRLTIDLDSSVFQRHGKGQAMEGATKGYNPKSPGHLSHHPIMAFSDDVNMVVNAWMRPGNTADSFQAADFLEETIAIAGGRERVGLLRADAGFYGDKLLRACEGTFGSLPDDDAYRNPYLLPAKPVRSSESGDEEPSAWVNGTPIDYIVRAKVSNRLAVVSSEIEDKEWNSAEIKLSKKGHMTSEYTVIEYQAASWQKPRRIVLVRRLKEANSSGLQPKLFAADERLAKYTLMAFVTSLELSGKEIHKLYNGRADCENRIKELKYDFGVDGFALSKLAATEAAFALVMITYNIMGLLKQYVLKNNQQLGTIRFQCIAIGSYLVSSGRKKIMRLSAEGKRRQFLEHIFDTVDNITAELV